MTSLWLWCLTTKTKTAWARSILGPHPCICPEIATEGGVVLGGVSAFFGSFGAFGGQKRQADTGSLAVFEGGGGWGARELAGDVGKHEVAKVRFWHRMRNKKIGARLYHFLKYMEEWAFVPRREKGGGRGGLARHNRRGTDVHPSWLAMRFVRRRSML